METGKLVESRAARGGEIGARRLMQKAVQGVKERHKKRLVKPGPATVKTRLACVRNLSKKPFHQRTEGKDWRKKREGGGGGGGTYPLMKVFQAEGRDGERRQAKRGCRKGKRERGCSVRNHVKLNIERLRLKTTAHRRTKGTCQFSLVRGKRRTKEGIRNRRSTQPRKVQSTSNVADKHKGRREWQKAEVGSPVDAVKYGWMRPTLSPTRC